MVERVWMVLTITRVTASRDLLEIAVKWVSFKQNGRQKPNFKKVVLKKAHDTL